MEFEKIGVVILNFRGWKDTIECLESVFKLSYPNYEVVVVDNFSEDESLEKIMEWAEGRITVQDYNPRYTDLIFPFVEKPLKYEVFSPGQMAQFSSDARLTLIANTSNAGFSAGNNLGISFLINEKACKYVWLLNNDTVVDPMALQELYNSYQHTKADTGIVGSKLLFYSNPAIIQNIGARYNKWLATTKEYASHEPDHGQYAKDKFVELVQGASMLVSKEFLDDVGLLADDFFLYYEEIDWAIRAKRKGWKCLFSSKSVVYHKAGASTGATANKNNKSYLSDYYHLKNKIVLTKKFYPYCILTVYLSFIAVAINRIRRKQLDRIPLIFKIILNS